MSGLLMGILLARTFSGFVGAQLGWRTMFWISSRTKKFWEKPRAPIFWKEN